MIDFFKVEIVGARAEDFRNHPHLEFEAKMVLDSGEVKDNKYEADFRRLKFIIVRGKKVFIHGSLHKYFSPNGINHDDFTLENIHEALYSLSQEFGFRLADAKLHNLEFGVNVLTPEIPHTYIESLINHKGESFQDMYGKAKNTGRQSTKQQYIIKVYNKGLQCNLPDKVLRFEIKVIKMQFLKKYSISLLSHLIEPGKLRSLQEELVSTCKDLLMNDPGINWLGCTKSGKAILSHGRYPEYWKKLKKADSRNHDYQRMMFRDLTIKHGTGFQEQFVELIQLQADHLLSVDDKTLLRLTNSWDTEKSRIAGDFFFKLTVSGDAQSAQINNSNGMLKRRVNSHSPDDRICPDCGELITERDEQAVFCCEACRQHNKEWRRTVRNNLKRTAHSILENPALFNSSPYIHLSVAQEWIATTYKIQFDTHARGGQA